jgi:hyperosmotically inducible protein
MNGKIITACFVVATLVSPLAARAATDGDTDRAQPETYVKDSLITTKVKTKLAAEHLSSLAKVSVDTDRNGVVVLSGTATDQGAVNKAASIARDTEGVVSVQNNIKVKKDD